MRIDVYEATGWLDTLNTFACCMAWFSWGAASQTDDPRWWYTMASCGGIALAVRVVSTKIQRQ